MSYELSQPLWLLLTPALILLNVIVVRFSLLNKQKNNLETPSVYLPYLIKNTESNIHSENKIPYFYWLIIFLISISLSQPVNNIKKQTNPDSLKDIIFMIDTSVGMSIKDYSLNGKAVDRITLLKAVLIDFIGELEGNRMGLVVYADNAYTLVPLTRDKNLLIHSVSRIEPAIAGRRNDLSNALSTVIKQFDFGQKKPSVIILSQGANIETSLNPILLAQKYKELLIKLHFVGLGSLKDQGNNSTGLIFDPIDNKLLKKLSNITGGEYFWAGKSDNLNNILSAISRSESFSVNKSDYYLTLNYYQWILYIVMFLLSVSTTRHWIQRLRS